MRGGNVISAALFFKKGENPFNSTKTQVLKFTLFQHFYKHFAHGESVL